MTEQEMMSLRCVDNPKARMPAAMTYGIRKERQSHNHEYGNRIGVLPAVREEVLQILHRRLISVRPHVVLVIDLDNADVRLVVPIQATVG